MRELQLEFILRRMRSEGFLEEVLYLLLLLWEQETVRMASQAAYRCNVEELRFVIGAPLPP